MEKRKRLQDQLEDLFSDVEVPEPIEPTEAEVQAPPVEQIVNEPEQIVAPVLEAPPPPAPAPEPVEEERARLEEEEIHLHELERQVNLLQRANYQLQKRAIHLEASATVSQTAASTLDPQELMQNTVDLIRTKFHFYHVSFFLLDETREWAVVRASTGDVGEKMVALPHKLAVGGESMVGWVCANHQPRIALDVGADAVHFDHPLLPNTRSEVVLPLIVEGRLLGALDVQSTEEAAFDDDDMRTLQGMADLVATALENAHLFSEARSGAQHERFVTRVTDRLQQATSIPDMLRVTLEDMVQTFDLAQAIICLGTETEILAAGNGHDSAQAQEE